MLSKKVFTQHFAILADRFNRKVSAPVAMSYYEASSNALTTEQFIQAAKGIFNENQFWPSPSEFIDKVKGQVEDAAQLEWMEVMSAVKEDRKRNLTASGKAAFDAIGGRWTVLNTSNPSGLRRDFIAAYVATERREGTEQALPALPDVRVKELAENVIQGQAEMNYRYFGTLANYFRENGNVWKTHCEITAELSGVRERPRILFTAHSTMRRFCW